MPRTYTAANRPKAAAKLSQPLEKKDAADAALFYLLNKAVLLNDVKKGQPVTLKDVDLSSLEAYKLYLKGLEL